MNTSHWSYAILWKVFVKLYHFFRAIFYHLWCWWTWWRHNKGWNSCPWMPWFSFLIGWSRDWRCWLYFQHDGCGFKRKCYWERILEQSFDNDLTADPPFLNLFEHLSYSLVWVCKRYLLVVSVLFCFVWKMQIKNGISSSNCCVQYFTYESKCWWSWTRLENRLMWSWSEFLLLSDMTTNVSCLLNSTSPTVTSLFTLQKSHFRLSSCFFQLDFFFHQPFTCLKMNLSMC